MTDRITGTWPLLHRNDEVTAVLDSLTDPRLAGVLIVGDPGQGKTAIAREAAARMNRKAHVVFVRGSSAISETPFGALGVLLLEVDTPPSTSTSVSLLTLQSIERALEQQAAGLPAILIVDNVDLLDEASVMVLCYLAAVGAARLMIACDGPARAPAPFFDLWSTGRLARVDVSPLGFDALKGLLKDLLGAPVTGSAAVHLWRASRGNPRYLQAAVRSDIASGRLVLGNGAWVFLDNGEAGAFSPRNDAVLGMLSSVTGEHRAALELVAVTGSVPLDTLLGFTRGEVADELEQLGLCEIRDTAPCMVTVINDAVRDRVRSWVVANPPAALIAMLRDTAWSSALQPAARLSVALCLLDARVDLPAVQLLQAARLANDLGAPVIALRALQTLPRTDAATVLEYARACLAQGQVRDGYDAVTKMLDSTALDGRSTTVLLAEQVRLAVRSPEHHGEASDLLERLDALVTRAVMQDDGRIVAPRADPRSVARDLAVHEGNFRAVLALGPGPGDAAAHLILAHAATGSPMEAPSSGRSAHPGDVSSPAPGRHALQESTFLALVQRGHLQDASALAAAPALLGYAWEDASVAEFFEGCALAAAGQGKPALSKLLPAIEQFRVGDRRALMPLAEAAAAYSFALVGKSAEARNHARRVDAADPGTPWLKQAGVRLFTTLTHSLLKDGDVAARLFALMANEQRDRGNSAVEMLLRVHAVRLGRRAGAAPLLHLARSIDGPFAAAGGLLASGVLDQDPVLLLACAEAGLEMGHLDLAGSAALLSMQLHDVEDEPLDFIRAEQIFRGTHVLRRNTDARQVLTDRERAFARLAAKGATNKEIAGAYHLSVRTVEGHVLNAMTKLRISKRKQLSTVFNR